MAAQALCDLQAQGSLGPKPAHSRPDPKAAAQALSPLGAGAEAAEATAGASERCAEVSQPGAAAAGFAASSGIQGLGKGSGSADPADLLNSRSGQEEADQLADALRVQVEAAPSSSHTPQQQQQQLQVWDSEQAAALAQLSQQLVGRLGREAHQQVTAMRMPQVSGIASCLARLRYQDAAFFRAAAAKVCSGRCPTKNAGCLALVRRQMSGAVRPLACV